MKPPPPSHRTRAASKCTSTRLSARCAWTTSPPHGAHGPLARAQAAGRARLDSYYADLERDLERRLKRAEDETKQSGIESKLAAARTALRLFRGRGLLCDEVGLGKTIEAGLILKEYLSRRMVSRVLIVTPPPQPMRPPDRPAARPAPKVKAPPPPPVQPRDPGYRLDVQIETDEPAMAAFVLAKGAASSPNANGN